MDIITLQRLRDFMAKHPDSATALEKWHRAVSQVTWRNLVDVRLDYPHADPVKVAGGETVTVFNIGGNKCRMATSIHYRAQRVYVLKIMTHAEYSKGHWKGAL